MNRESVLHAEAWENYQQACAYRRAHPGEKSTLAVNLAASVLQVFWQGWLEQQPRDARPEVWDR
jgi:hypothetical protein